MTVEVGKRVVELCPVRGGLAQFERTPGISPRGRSRRVVLTWFDDSQGTLRAAGLAASRHEGGWRFERLVPGGDEAWAPGAPPPVLAEAAAPEALDAVASAAVEVARFAGREQSYALAGADGVDVSLLSGTVSGTTIRRPASRLRVAGSWRAVEAACSEIASRMDLTVPHGGLAAEALGVEPTAPDLPPLPARASVGAFVATALPCLIWPVLIETSTVARAPSPVAIHQARVAVRRLRSVIGVLRGPLAGSIADELRPALQELASRLGAARDWDVFLDGLGSRLSALFGDADGTKRLLLAAHRRQKASYAALAKFLARPEQRTLERRLAFLAALRSWEDAEPEPGADLAGDAVRFAAAVLDRRLRRLRRAGKRFKALPIEALHDLRKDSKRLRYAAEIFAPLFPGHRTRRFLKRLRAVQAALGDLQDAATARALLAQLGNAGCSYAGGLAVGLAEGHGASLRADATIAWRRFGKTEPFWT